MRKNKGQESKLRYGVCHVTENRNHFVVKVKTAPAASVTEREASLDLLAEIKGEHLKTLGGDKAFDTHDYVDACRVMKFTPHFAQNIERKGGSSIDERTTRHPGYKISLRRRKMIEATFGWVKQYGGLRRIMYRGMPRVDAAVTFAVTVYNLLRINNLQPHWQE